MTSPAGEVVTLVWNGIDGKEQIDNGAAFNSLGERFGRGAGFETFIDHGPGSNRQNVPAL